jgi:hypothetical protein
MAVFAASISTSIVSLIHAGAIMSDNLVSEALLAFTEMSISLLVCNLAVILAISLRYLRHALHLREELEENPRLAPRQDFTTLNTTRLARMFRLTELREEIALRDTNSRTRVDVDQVDAETGEGESERKPGTSTSVLDLEAQVTEHHPE